SLERVVELALPHLVEAGRFPLEMTDEQKEWAKELIALYQEQLHYGREIVELTELFFKQEIQYNEEAMTVLNEEQIPEVMQGFLDQL
ncbi:glutamate--tRNA ligase, partial [Staphylococcus sp. SIMBA_130]